MRKLSWLALPLLLGAAAGAQAVLQPQTVLTAQILGPPRQSMPRELTVRIRPSVGLKGRKENWETTVTCPVRNGLWRCAVPAAGRIDLKIEGTAVMPVYRWGEGIGEGQTVHLGVLKLRRGATISGWLQVDGETGRPEIPEHAVQVKLVPLEAPRIGLRPNPIPNANLETRSQPWGFFRFDNLKPGQYAVVTSEPDRAPARFGPVQILGDRSVELRRPLRLRRPAALNGRIDPPVQTGLRQPWQIRLIPKPSPFPGEELAAVSRLDGTWSFANLSAGDYLLSVKDTSGTTWMARDIHLAPGAQNLSVQVPTTRLVGLVTRAGKPLKTRLELTGMNATGPFKGDTDADGIFPAAIPDAPDQKVWSVRLLAPDGPPIYLEDPFPSPIPPKPSPANPQGRAEIQVPDTCLPVTVVDSRRRPVPFARIIVSGSPENRFQADEKGFCEIRGLKAGLREVLAEHPQLLCRSEIAKVELREGIKAPLLCLSLPDAIEVYGRVEPAFGTATGALIVARLPGAGPAISTRADQDGEFRLVLPTGTRIVDLAVLAPGAAFRKLRAEVDPKRLLQVPVDAAGGTLVLEIPERILKTARNSRALESDLELLCRWADLQGCQPEPGRLVVPNVEPGPYTLTAGESLKLEPGEPADAADPRPHGVLAAEGELAMRLTGGA